MTVKNSNYNRAWLLSSSKIQLQFMIENFHTTRLNHLGEYNFGYSTSSIHYGCQTPCKTFHQHNL